MLIRGIGLPLDEINNAANPWGIKNSTTEINRILKSAPGSKLRMCKECFTNPSDAHACDLDARAIVGTIKTAKYDNKKNAVKCDVDVTDADISNKIRTGQIKKMWSPTILSDYQDDEGYLHNVTFDGLTLVGVSAFNQCTFDMVSVAEGADDETTPPGDEDDTTPTEDEESETDTTKKKLGMNKKSAPPEDTVTLKKEDYDKLMKLIDPDIKEEEKKEEPKMTEPPNGELEYMTMDQVKNLLEQERLEMEKEHAIGECRVAAGKIGMKDLDFESMKSLPIEQIQKMTTNYRNIAGKIPVDKKESNKPFYYNEDTGVGMLDGSVSLTVGIKDENGNWTDKY